MEAAIGLTVLSQGKTHITIETRSCGTLSAAKSIYMMCRVYKAWSSAEVPKTKLGIRKQETRNLQKLNSSFQANLLSN